MFQLEMERVQCRLCSSRQRTQEPTLIFFGPQNAQKQNKKKNIQYCRGFVGPPRPASQTHELAHCQLTVRERLLREVLNSTMNMNLIVLRVLT